MDGEARAVDERKLGIGNSGECVPLGALVDEQVVAAVDPEVLAPGHLERLLKAVDVAWDALAAVRSTPPASDGHVSVVFVRVVEGFLYAARPGARGVWSEIAAVVRALKGDGYMGERVRCDGKSSGWIALI